MDEWATVPGAPYLPFSQLDDDAFDRVAEQGYCGVDFFLGGIEDSFWRFVRLGDGASQVAEVTDRIGMIQCLVQR